MSTFLAFFFFCFVENLVNENEFSKKMLSYAFVKQTKHCQIISLTSVGRS